MMSKAPYLGRFLLVHRFPFLEWHAIHRLCLSLVIHLNALRIHAVHVPGFKKKRRGQSRFLRRSEAHHLDKQFLQKPVKFITSIFCTSERFWRCFTSSRKAYASAAICEKHDDHMRMAFKKPSACCSVDAMKEPVHRNCLKECTERTLD